MRLITSGLTFHASLLIEIQLNGVVLTKLDKKANPVKIFSLINLNIFLYVALQLVDFRHGHTIQYYFSLSKTYEYL